MRSDYGRLNNKKPSKYKALADQVTASRFRESRQLCCLSVDETAKILRVTPRTVHNWESGSSSVPYSAYKLMRILRGYELPGEHWKGFRLCGDTLWSPEGLAFKASDHYWWSLTCRMAAEFRALCAGRRLAQGFLVTVGSKGPGGIPYQPDSAPLVSNRHQIDPGTRDFSPVAARNSALGPGSNTGQKTPRKSAHFAQRGAR